MRETSRKKVQNKNIARYKAGHLMWNNSKGKKQVEAFKFLDKMYISNQGRSKKYSFDDIDWHHTKSNFFRNAYRVMSGKYKVAIDCNKSMKVGV